MSNYDNQIDLPPLGEGNQNQKPAQPPPFLPESDSDDDHFQNEQYFPEENNFGSDDQEIQSLPTNPEEEQPHQAAPPPFIMTGDDRKSLPNQVKASSLHSSGSNNFEGENEEEEPPLQKLDDNEEDLGFPDEAPEEVPDEPGAFSPAIPPLDDEDQNQGDASLQRIGQDFLDEHPPSNNEPTQSYDESLVSLGETTETTLDDENPLTKLLQLLHLNPNPFKDSLKDREIQLETDGYTLCASITAIDAQWTEEKNRLIHPHCVIQIRGQTPVFQTNVTNSPIFNLTANLHPLDVVEDIIDVILYDGGREVGRYSVPVKELEADLDNNFLAEIGPVKLHLNLSTKNVPISEVSQAGYIETQRIEKQKPQPSYRVLDVTVAEALYAPEGRREKMSRPRADLGLHGLFPHLRTDALKDINRPKWRETYTLLCPDPERDVVEIVLLDGNVLVGSAKILVKHLPLGQDCDKWYKLTPAEDQEPGGKIHLIFHAAQVKLLPDECVRFVASEEPPVLEVPEFAGPPKHNCVKITAVEGRSLSPGVGRAVIDARLGFQMRGFEPLVCTHLKKQTCNPAWGEFFLFDAPKPLAELGALDIQLYDGQTRNGHTTVPVGQIAADKVIDGWLDIDTGGQVHLRMEWKRYPEEKPPQSLITLKKGGKNSLPSKPLPPTPVKTNSGKRKRTRYVWNGIVDESGVTRDTTTAEDNTGLTPGLTTIREPLKQSDFGGEGSAVGENSTSVTGDQPVYSQESGRRGLKQAPTLQTGASSTTESTTGAGMPAESGLDSNIITGISENDFAPWQPGSEEPVNYEAFSPANDGNEAPEGTGRTLTTATQLLQAADFGPAHVQQRNVEMLLNSSTSEHMKSASETVSEIEFSNEAFQPSPQKERVKKAPPLPSFDSD